MSEPPFIRSAAYLLGMATYLWLMWRSLKTGMPAGNPTMNPRRYERPLQFWMVVGLYALGAIILGIKATGL